MVSLEFLGARIGCAEDISRPRYRGAPGSTVNGSSRDVQELARRSQRRHDPHPGVLADLPKAPVARDQEVRPTRDRRCQYEIGLQILRNPSHCVDRSDETCLRVQLVKMPLGIFGRDDRPKVGFVPGSPDTIEDACRQDKLELLLHPTIDEQRWRSRSCECRNKDVGVEHNLHSPTARSWRLASRSSWRISSKILFVSRSISSGSTSRKWRRMSSTTCLRQDVTTSI